MATKFLYDDTGPYIHRDPADVLDYRLDWAATGEDWLDGDTITGTPTWVVGAGLTKASQSNTTTTTTVWLSGGTVDTTYTVSCTIVTAAGRTCNRSFRVVCVDR